MKIRIFGHTLNYNKMHPIMQKISLVIAFLTGVACTGWLIAGIWFAWAAMTR